MAKPVPPEGRWKSVSVSLREADLARLDTARGSVDRSTWARGVLLAALGGAPEWESPAPERPRPEFEERRIEQEMAAAYDPAAFPQSPPKRSRRPRGAPAKAALAQERQQDVREGACSHPKARRGKGGLCMACGQNVGEQR